MPSKEKKDEDLFVSGNAAKPIVGRSFVLSELESKRLENWIKEGCKSIKFDFGGGIGTKVSVQAKNNKWVDITDYGCW